VPTPRTEPICKWESQRTAKQKIVSAYPNRIRHFHNTNTSKANFVRRSSSVAKQRIPGKRSRAATAVSQKEKGRDRSRPSW
jgi:hypothetical protein